MDKLRLAHDFSMKLVGNPTTPLKDMDSIIAASWRYADAMQAEAKERVNKERPDVLKEEWQPYTYPEYEHGRDYPSDAWVTFNGEARLAVSIKKNSLQKRPQ